MGRYFANYLTGLLMMIVFCGLASSYSLPFQTVEDELERDALMKEIQDNDIAPKNYDDLSKLKKSSRKRKLREYMSVNLKGSHDVITIEEGSSYTLTCFVNSVPSAEVYVVHGPNALEEIISRGRKRTVPLWHKEKPDVSMSRGNAKYVIDCADKNDEGPYHCVAIADGKVLVDSIDVLIVDVDREAEEETCDLDSERAPVITNYLETIFSVIGSKVILPCKAYGTPEPKIHWYQPTGKEIINHHDRHYEIRRNGDLVINDLTWENDFANFTCVAKSGAGVDSVLTFVYPFLPNV